MNPTPTPSWVFPWSPFVSMWSHRILTGRLAWREVASRYRGSIFGFAWAVLVPLIMLVIYTFVFSVVFQTRWGSAPQSRTEFALVLFSGLIIFNLFAECISRAPGLILSNATYVKKVIFPLEVLPAVAQLSALFTAALSTLVLGVAYIFSHGQYRIEMLLIPVFILPLLFINQGVMYFFSSLGVYVRDLQQIIGLIVTVMMFLSPLFYPLDAIPERFRSILLLNPLSTIIDAVRTVLFSENPVHWFPWSMVLLASLIFQWLGFMWFMKTRKGFADVL